MSSSSDNTGGAMISGAGYWDDRDRYYSQENNPTEAFLKATIDSRFFWLESCGPTSAVNCLSAMGFRTDVECPGAYEPQPEEVLMDFFNDPRNKAKLDAVRVVADNIPENRVPQYYPVGVKEVFDAVCEFKWGPTFKVVADLVSSGHAVQVCLVKPSHYIAVVAYDTIKKELVYHDSHGSRFADGKGGFARRMTEDEFKSNVQPYYIVYGAI